LTEQATDTATDTACRLLRLPPIRNEFADIADRAVKNQMTHRGFLAELLMTECDDRARRRSERRIKAAGFPREKSLRAFDFDANPTTDPATIHALANCEWINERFQCEHRSGDGVVWVRGAQRAGLLCR
jgi:DNA replication protein DnaC